MNEKTVETTQPIKDANEPAARRDEKPRKKLAFVVRTGVKAGVILCRH